jgi:purine-nucleoside phosphorylase
MIEKIKETTGFLQAKGIERPRIGMIAGTGLGGITERMAEDFAIAYEEIPHFPKSTIKGHKGRMVFGKLADKPMMAMDGRFHAYEGYSMEEITFSVRVMARLGVEHLLISSAAGGLNPLFKTGDLMILTDHINLTGANPLIGPNLDDFGPRFPDMTQVYDPNLIALATAKALESGILIRHGVYVAVLGPSLETGAETRFLRMIGADAVGMSTVAEAIVAVHCGLSIIAIVVITNVNLPDCMEKTSIEEVISNAEQAGSKLSRLWEAIVGSLS